MEFLEIHTKADLATYLGTSVKMLDFYSYALPPAQRYKFFEISKRKGGMRQIAAPIKPIKTFQKKIANALETLYTPRHTVYGYIKGKAALDNASVHTRKRWVLKVDLHDFFPSINFGRVYGVFLAPPFNFDRKVAASLAQLLVLDNQLPQGSPASPVISNLICKGLDRQLGALASALRCTYSRYVDDLTFSTNRRNFPSELCEIITTDEGRMPFIIGGELERIIVENGFAINQKKIRMSENSGRQLVTGLVVNSKLNITKEYYENLRNVMYIWKQYGKEAAEKKFAENNLLRSSFSHQHGDFDFAATVQGNIQYVGQVKGWNNRRYLKLATALEQQVPSFKINRKKVMSAASSNILVFAEGKTDYIHLRNALEKLKIAGEFKNLSITFDKSNEDRGHSALLNLCQTLSTTEQPRLTIFIFDRDVENITKKVTDSASNYRYWGNNVFSLAIPVPTHRSSSESIQIEDLYLEAELTALDKDGRRFFRSSEFDLTNGFHSTKEYFWKYPDKNRSLITSDVAAISTGASVALSKHAFSQQVENKASPFDKLNIDGFRPVFEEIEKIVVAVSS